MIKKKSPPQKHDGETETRILNAAKAVFIRHGTSGARMQDIAEEAGVNQALLHYYFRSKEKLSEAVFRETAGRMFPALFQIVGSDMSLNEKIDLIVDTYLTQMTRTPFIPGSPRSRRIRFTGALPSISRALGPSLATSAS